MAVGLNDVAEYGTRSPTEMILRLFSRAFWADAGPFLCCKTQVWQKRVDFSPLGLRCRACLLCGGAQSICRIESASLFRMEIYNTCCKDLLWIVCHVLCNTNIDT